METKLNAKIQTYVNQFKHECITKLNETQNTQALIQYILDYPQFTVDIQDLQKRKRVRNAVPICERCIANRINNTQCTRRRQVGFEFCGTHIKGQPYGIIQDQLDTNKPVIKNVNIRNEEINGIHYYIDDNNNVYNTEDILSNKPNPTIITKYTTVNGKIGIPEYFNK